MAQLERRLMRLKVEANNDASYGLQMLPIVGAFVPDKDNTSSIMLEYNDIKDAMDKCNAKYEKLIEQNAEVVELALADAIRFSDKDLKDIELDMDAVKADSDKVLAKFKEDAKGVKVKEQANLLQRMTSSIETHVRKYMRDCGGYHQKNTAALLAIAKITGITLTSLGASELIKQATQGEVDIAGSVKTAAVDAYNNKVAPAVASIPPIRDTILNKTSLAAFNTAKEYNQSDETSMHNAIAGEVYAWALAGFPSKSKVSKAVKDLIQATYADSDKLTYVYELPYLVSIDFGDTVITNTSKKQVLMAPFMLKYINKHPEVAWPKQFVTDLSSAKEKDGNDYFGRFMNIYLEKVINIQDVPKFKSTIRSYRTDWKAAQAKT